MKEGIVAAAFVAEVRERSELPTAGAARHTVWAVLATLAEHLPNGWAHHLAADLPPEIGWLLRLGTRRPWSTGGDAPFLTTLSARAAVGPARARFLAHSVLGVLARTCDPALMRRIGTTLTDELRALLPTTEPA